MESRLFFGTWIGPQKQAEAFPKGDKPKAKWDKRTNGKGRRSGKGNERGKQKYVTKILKKGLGLNLPPLSPTELSECKFLTTHRLANWPLFSKFAIFIYLNSVISMGVMSSCWIIASSLTCPKFTVFISPIKPVTDKLWIRFVYTLASMCFFVMYSLKLSNLTYISAQRF